MRLRRPSETPGRWTVRVDWMPGTLLLAAGIGAGVVLGFAAGAGRPPVYLSIAVCALIVGLGLATWRRTRRPAAADAQRARAEAQGAPRVPFDLSRDRSTDAQKYVM